MADSMDIDNIATPEFFAEKGTQHPEWTEAEIQDLNENITYYTEMLDISNQLKDKGYLDQGRNIPNAPKVSIKNLLYPKSKLPIDINNKHNYLVSKLIFQSKNSTVPDISKLATDATLEMIKTDLIKGYDCLRSKNKYVISTSMKFGAWLQRAYKQFKIEKLQGSVKGSWAKWLKDNIDISESYGRQLREIYKLFHNYPKICHLGIQFSEIYKDKNDIFKVVSSDEHKVYWMSDK